MTDHEIQCDQCPATVADVETAIDAGWAPSYYFQGDDCETSNPLCPNCVAKCTYNERTGDYVWPYTEFQSKVLDEVSQRKLMSVAMDDATIAKTPAPNELIDWVPEAIPDAPLAIQPMGIDDYGRLGA